MSDQRRQCEIRDDAAYQAGRGRIQRLIAKHCPEGLLVDVGGGDGAILAGWGAVVLDLDAAMLGTAQDAGSMGVSGDMAALPFRCASVDRFLLCHSLEHCPDTERVLREVGRALKPGGHMVVVVPNAAALRQIQTLLSGDVRPAGNRPLEPPQHQHHYTLPLLMDVLAGQPWAEVLDVRGDVANFPLMRTLGLRWLGAWLAWICPRLSDAIIAVCRKGPPAHE